MGMILASDIRFVSNMKRVEIEKCFFMKFYTTGL